METDDTLEQGGESLTIDQAAAAYAKASATKEPEGQPEAPDESESGTTDDETLEAEADSEDADGETDAEDQAEDGEDAAESEQGRYVGHNGRVKLPDGTEATVADLIQGSLRQADYTRKTQEVSELRKQAETQSSTFKQRETQLTQREQYVATLIQSILPKEPDPSMLDTDPVGYMKAQRDFQAWGQHLGQIQQHLQQSETTKQEETATSAREKATAEWNALVEKAPELKDQTKAKAFGDKLLAHGKAYGFSEDELRFTLPADHRLALAMRDAIKWRELQASKPRVQQKVEGRPPVQKGGKRLNPSEAKARQASDALTRLGQTGRLDDAVAALLATQK